MKLTNGQNFAKKIISNMYLNFKLAKELNISPQQILLLQAIKQQGSEKLDDIIPLLIQEDTLLENLSKNQYIKLIKGKKDQSEIERLRITSKGTKLLEDISTPEITEGDLQMYSYLENIYLSHEDEERHIGNKKKTKIYCAIFRNYLSLSLHQMYWLCWLFLQEYSHTKRLEYIFFNSNKQRYGKFQNNIEDSPLYQYYDQNKEKIENFWKKKGL